MAWTYNPDLHLSKSIGFFLNFLWDFQKCWRKKFWCITPNLELRRTLLNIANGFSKMTKICNILMHGRSS